VQRRKYSTLFNIGDDGSIPSLTFSLTLEKTNMATERSDETWSWMKEVMPFVAMLMVTCLDMSVLTIVKAAMNDGMSSIVYIVYHDVLAILILLPFFIIGFFRNGDRPPLSLHLLFRLFVLGFLGMERIEIKSSSTIAKLSGTIIAIFGAMLFTLYQGPEIFHMSPFSHSSNQVHLSRPSNWIFGGLILIVGGIFNAIWKTLQSATAREYPDQRTMVFFYCLFGTIQCIAISPFLEPNPQAWVLQPGTEIIAIILGAVFSVVFRSTVITWCLEKKGPGV
ncbi:hypothetical protein M8C21_019427, partial [Ambrosia artemisiifolia]